LIDIIFSFYQWRGGKGFSIIVKRDQKLKGYYFMELTLKDGILIPLTLVFAITSVCLGKCYLSEREKNLAQLQVNQDAEITTGTLLQRITASGSELQDRCNQLCLLRDELQNRNNQLSNENRLLGGDELHRLQEINNQIEDLQGQIHVQLDRNAEAEAQAQAENAAEDRILRITQDIEHDIAEETARLNAQIVALHNEFLAIEMPHIRAEVQVREYQRQIRLMQAFHEIITAEGRLSPRGVDLSKIRQTAFQDNDRAIEKYQEVLDRIDQKIASRTIPGRV
jgi:hypothetical protein